MLTIAVDGIVNISSIILHWWFIPETGVQVTGLRTIKSINLLSQLITFKYLWRFLFDAIS